jgi:hypothetical protein
MTAVAAFLFFRRGTVGRSVGFGGRGGAVILLDISYQAARPAQFLRRPRLGPGTGDVKHALSAQ